MQSNATVISEKEIVRPGSIWRNKNYVYMWLGRTISQFGDKLYLLALPWLVLELTGSVISATLTLALEVITEILFAPIAGALVDRYSRKGMMIFTDLLRGILMLSIPVLAYFEVLQVGYIYFIAISLTLLTLMFDSAAESYLPTILAKEQLMDANAKLTMIATIMRVIGPVVAGVLITFFGAAETIGLNGLSFILSLFFLLFITNTNHLSPANSGSEIKNITLQQKLQSFSNDVKEGLSYLVKHPILWPITLFSALMNFSILGVSGLFVFESKEGLAASPSETSTIFWVSGIFAFLATLLVKPLNKYLTKGQLIRFGALGVGLALGTVAIHPSILTMTICYTLLLMIGIFVGVSMMTVRQEIVPNHLLGRVMTSSRVISQSVSPISIILAGVVAHYYSVQTVFIIATILIGINVCIAWFGKMKNIT